jgi:hypothetical protein
MRCSQLPARPDSFDTRCALGKTCLCFKVSQSGGFNAVMLLPSSCSLAGSMPRDKGNQERICERLFHGQALPLEWGFACVCPSPSVRSACATTGRRVDDHSSAALICKTYFQRTSRRPPTNTSWHHPAEAWKNSSITAPLQLLLRSSPNP